jgi:hypothetical protein
MNLKKLGVTLAIAVGFLATVASGESETTAGDTKSSDGATAAPSADSAGDTKLTGAAADVTISSCALSENDFIGPEAGITVKNNSSKASNYIINIAFESADGTTQLDTGFTAVNNLAPGQSAQETASSLKSETRETAGDFTCRVTDVTRYAS